MWKVFPLKAAHLPWNYHNNKSICMDRKVKILLAEDDLQLGFIIKDNLEEAGFEVINCPDDITPILFLTAKSLMEDKLKGFSAGGDDYIVKPFNMKELLSRIQVFLRRNKMFFRVSAKEFRIGRFSFFPDELRLVYGDNEIILTSREKDLLEFLCTHPKLILKREEILINVWGKNDFFLGRSMDVFMMRLRKYLAPDPSVMIETIHGIGYRFVC